MIFVIVITLFPGICAAQSTDTTRPKIGLVLSGGGARGAAHVGVIKVLDELRIPIDYIAGTSMGAIVGGLYASGMSASDLEQNLNNADWSKLLSDRPARAQRSFRRKGDDAGFLVNLNVGVNKDGLVLPQGFVQGQTLTLALKRMLLPVATINSFDRLPIPFRAIATNITSGEAVVLDSGDLPTAIRASMSAPGVFKPVRVDGQVLVDGGVANNLPVGIVKAMGADVLIVVDVGTPLVTEEAELNSPFKITSQMLRILINARTDEQKRLITPQDVLITPALGGLSTSAFDQTPEAMRLGEATARQSVNELRKFSLSEATYVAHRQSLERARSDIHVINRVVIENESKLSTEVIGSRLADQEGKPLDLDQLESDITDIYGFDTFETVTYDVLDDADGTNLSVRATEKSWGPNYMRFGINLEDDFDGNSSYNVAARFTRTEINELGGEVRAEIQIGESPRIFAELYQPLDFASRWFVNPQIEFLRAGSGMFDNNGLQIAQFGSDQIRMSLDGGRQFGNLGEFRLGVTHIQSDSELRIGSPELKGESNEITAVTAGFAYDTIDRNAVPRSGANISSGWSGSRESLGSDGTFDLAQLSILKPQTWGNNTLLHWWTLGSTVRDETDGLSPFSLGGLFNLSGYAAGELVGKHFGIGRVLYYYRLGDRALSALQTPIYLGASFEAGNVWPNTNAISLDNTLIAGSVFIVFDSLLGPLYLAYGAGEGDRRSAYLFLGQTF